jgi:exonuclease III
MADIYKIAPLNINGISSGMIMMMLQEFLQKQEIDILLSQEVTHTEFDMIRGYKAHTNIGINNRGTAMLTRGSITPTNIMGLLSGRGMAACYRGVWIVNIYTPSGSSRRQERENFYKVELTYLLWSIPPTMIIGGDFNCVLSQTDRTGNMNYSTALDRMVRGLDLTDVWETISTRAIYTHYTPHGAARLDRMYVSPNMKNRNTDVETVMAAFIDHLPVCLRLTLDAPIQRRGRGRWKMNVSLLDYTTFNDQVQQEWLQWRQQERKYLDTVTWWVNYAKRKIRFMFNNEGKERVRTERMNEHFYYTCTYDVLQDPIQHREKVAKLNHLEAKIVKLHNNRLQAINIDTHEPTKFQGESPSLFHLLQMRKRRESRMIAKVFDENGTLQESIREILSTFVDYLKHKCGPIQTEENCVDQMMKAGFRTVAEPWRYLLDRPITLEEFKTVVYKGAGNKAPCNDGIGLAF